MVLLLTKGWWTGQVAALWPKQPGRQILRSLLDLANNFGVVVALRHLPLAMFYILIFLAPMVTTVLAALTLGEPLEWKKGLALLTGFCGVVIAVDPFGLLQVGDRAGYFACLVCVLCFSANLVWSRVLTQTENPESLTFCSGAVMVAAGFAAMSFHANPVTLRLALILGTTGVFCVVGSLCFFVALRRTSAAHVSQYHYSQLVTGALVSYLVWREKPTRFMVAGAALIVAAAVWNASLAQEKQPVAVALRG